MLAVLVVAGTAMGGCAFHDGEGEGDDAGKDAPDLFASDTEPTETLDVSVEGDSDLLDHPEAVSDPADVADGECHPAASPSCFWEDIPVSCDIAIGYFGTDGFDAVSPRARCEAECGQAGWWDQFYSYFCPFNGTGCFRVEDFECDACCTLSYFPPATRLNDRDPCTIDSCSGAECIHEPVDWIATPCGMTNDFGKCEGVLACDSWCVPEDEACNPGFQRCTASMPNPEVANGLDDDCDGSTDEAVDGVVRFSVGDNAHDPTVAALDDGRFVVGWRAETYDDATMEYLTRADFRVGNVSDALGGIRVTLDEGWVDGPCVWALPGGRFATVWQNTDYKSRLTPVVTPHLQIMTSPSDPPDYESHMPIGGDLFTPECVSTIGWPDGTVGVRVYSVNPAENELLRFRRIDRNGPFGETLTLSNDGTMGRQLLGTADGRVLMAWRSDSVDKQNRATFWARWFEADGVPATEAFSLTDEVYRAHGSASGPFLAHLADGSVLVVWSARPVYDTGLYFRAIKLVPLTPPNMPASQFAGDPVGRPEVVALSGWGNKPVMFWKDTTNKDNPTSLNAIWLDSDSLMPVRHQVIQTPMYGILEHPTVSSFVDGTMAVVWVYRPNLTGSGSTELRMAFVDR